MQWRGGRSVPARRLVCTGAPMKRSRSYKLEPWLYTRWKTGKKGLDEHASLAKARQHDATGQGLERLGSSSGRPSCVACVAPSQVSSRK